MHSPMLPSRPYLVRAAYDWILDSKCTPNIVINAHHPLCRIPDEYVEHGEIVLNVSPMAVKNFKISQNKVEFQAFFSGRMFPILVPIEAVIAIYAEETNQGIFDFSFEFEEKVGAIIDNLMKPKNDDNN